MKNIGMAHIVLLLALFLPEAGGQEEGAFKQNYFTEYRDGFKEARKNLRTGNYFYNKGQYRMALEYYTKTHASDPGNAFLNYRLAVCYLETHPGYKSLEYLKKAYSLNPAVAPDIHYRLGQGYQQNYKFDLAMEEYKTYRKNLTGNAAEYSKREVDKRIRECQSGKRYLENPADVRIANAGPHINSSYSEYRPLIFPGDRLMIFSSRRNTTTGGGKDPEDYRYYEDIYTSYNQSGTWGMATNITPKLNTMGHDAIVGMSSDARTLVYYNGRINGGDLAITKRRGDTWESPKSLPETINTPYCESSAAFSPSGDTLYFVSNRQDKTLGGKDIFRSVRGPDGQWGEARNLGKPLNTEYDEEGVYIPVHGKTMYFSSRGHASMGGYDVFRSERKPDGGWSAPENIGYPVNTPGEEVFFVISAEGDYGYYSSDRRGGLGAQDIYRWSIDRPEAPIVHETKEKFFRDDPADFAKTITESIQVEEVKLLDILAKEELRGKVRQVGLPVEIEIEIMDLQEGEDIKTVYPSGEEGRYEFILPAGSKYHPEIEIVDSVIRRGKTRLVDEKKLNRSIETKIEEQDE